MQSLSSRIRKDAASTTSALAIADREIYFVTASTATTTITNTTPSDLSANKADMIRGIMAWLPRSL